MAFIVLQLHILTFTARKCCLENSLILIAITRFSGTWVNWETNVSAVLKHLILTLLCTETYFLIFFTF